MNDRKQWQVATRCVHTGQRRWPAEFGLNTPIVTSSAFDYTDDGQVRYPRYLNTPNHQAVAAKIAALEGADDAIVTGSGMGAVAAVFLGLMRPGEHAVLLEGLYGGTTDLIEGLLKPFEFHFSVWDGDPASLPDLITPDTRLAWVESPTNPLLKLVDLEATARTLRTHRVISVIDNTFATPILQQPLAAGFDLVIHSATKYFGGHSDLLAGAIAGSEALIGRIRPHAIRLGSALNGQDLYLLERSLKTLALRVIRQSENAAAIAAWLTAQPGVDEVRYPGLPGHPDHSLANRQMHGGYGGIVTFRLAGRIDPMRFLSHLELITPAVSLAGVETTICQPSRTSHAKLEPAARAALGIDDRLMRLSAGIEDARDLIDELARALEA